MAKCKLVSEETGQCMATSAQWNKCKQDTCPMDKYTTDNCNMKRNAKYKKIKAWARHTKDGWKSVEAGNLVPLDIPCEIVINTKYLKAKR